LALFTSSKLVMADQIVFSYSSSDLGPKVNQIFDLTLSYMSYGFQDNKLKGLSLREVV
jgi:hypothetical protein